MTLHTTAARLRTVDLVYVALFSVLIAVCAWISIPATIPFTLQTFGIFAALTILGGRRGTYATVVYLLLGAVGLPVFSGFQAGIGTLLGATGGFILGFAAQALVYWLLTAHLGTSVPHRLCPEHRPRQSGHRSELVRDPLHSAGPGQVGSGHRPLPAAEKIPALILRFQNKSPRSPSGLQGDFPLFRRSAAWHTTPHRRE